MAKSIGLQLIEDRLKKQQEKGTQEYSSRTGKKIGDDFYTPDTDTLYRQYAKARGQKVAGGTANPIITSQRGVQANQNVSPSAERVAGRQTSYYDQMMQNKQKAEQMKANTKPSVRATAQDVKDALFGKAMNYGTVNPRISASEINTKYSSMTDDEASVYMTLRNQGRQAEADEYLKAVEYEINERNMNQTKQRAKEIGSDGVVAPLLYGAALSIPSSAGILYNAWQDAKGEATDMNHGAYGGSAAFNALYDAYVNGVNGEESPQWKKDLKGTAMTVAQMMGHMPAGMFAPLTMGASAASGASMDALNRGGTTEQALFGGLAAGAAEGAGSALSLGTMGKIFGKLGSKVSGKGMDRLRNLAKEIRKDKGRAIAIDLLKISGVEGSEEMVTEVMNALTDMAIMGENSNFNLVMEDAMAKGMSEEEAFDYAMKATGQNVLEAGKMGAMAGGLMGGLGMGVNAVTGRNIIPNNEEAIERARAQYEAATRQPETTAAEPVENPTVTPQNTSQNPVTVHETAISEELNNSPAEMRTQPAEAQTKQARERDSYLDKYYHENGANILRAEAEKRGSLQEAEDIYRPYYIAGLTGQAFDSVKGAMAVNADRSVAMEMYQAGVNDKAADMTARIKGQDKLRRSNTGVNLMTEAITDQQKALANLVARVGGMNVTIVDTLGKDGKVGNNGEYTRGTNEVVIAMDAESFSGTLFHETVHYIKQANAKGYERMAEAVFRMAAEMDGVSVSDYLRRYESMEAYGPAIEAGAYKFADVTEELIADAFQMLAADEARCRSLIAELKQTEPTVLEQIKEFLQKMLETLEGLVKDGRFHAFAEDINKDIENTKKLQKIFAEELREAGRTAETKTQPAEQTGYKFSNREKNEQTGIKAQIIASQNELNAMAVVAKIDSAEKTWSNNRELKNVVLRDLKSTGFKVDRKDFGIIEFSEKEINRSIDYVDTLAEALAYKLIPAVLKRGIVIGGHENHKGREYETVTIAAPVEIVGQRGNMAVVVRKTKGNRYKMHRVLTPDGKNFVVLDTKKTEPTSGNVAATQGNSEGKPISSVFNNNVAQQNAADNSKIAENVGVQIDTATESAAPKMSLRDSEGRKLSAGQNGYFKDSKAVDENGKLLVMYHGTRKGEFEAFRDWTYLTANRDYAERYTDKDTGKTMYEVYANIQKPFDTRLPEVREIFEGEFMGVYGGTPLQESGLPDWTDGYDLAEFIEENGYDFDAILLDEGADPDGKGGVIERGISYVIRSSEQAKDVKNLTPTSDKRLKFSVREKRDAEYMAAVSSHDMKKAQAMVDAAAEEAMPKSKLRSEDGKLRKVYHGTNETGFNVFDDKYIGMSSGDDGFFGMGHYFAFSRGEAEYYGRGRVIEAFLDLKNPFNFEKEFRMYKGKKANTGDAPDAIALMNLVDKFPDIAKRISLSAVKKGEYEYEEIPLEKFSEELKSIIDTKDFHMDDVANEYGETETIVYTDVEEKQYEYDGKVHKYKEYGWQQRFYGTPNPVDVAWLYMKEGVYRTIDMPNFTSLILDNNREFTAELKRRGYDGTIQSEYGDEAVVFDSSQIKQADPVTYDNEGNIIPLSERFNPNKKDIRWSKREYDDYYDDYVGETFETEAMSELNDVIREFNGITEGTIPHPRDVERISREFLHKIKSKYPMEEFSKKFSDILSHVMRARNSRDIDTAINALTILSKEAMGQSEKLNTEVRDKYRDVVTLLKETPLEITPAMKEELKDYGGFVKFRNQYFNRMKLNNSGEDVEEIYNKIVEMHPDLIVSVELQEGEELSKVDMLVALAEIVDNTKPYLENPYKMDMEKYAKNAAYELIGKINEVGTQAGKMLELHAEYKEKMSEMREQLKTDRREQALNRRRSANRRAIERDVIALRKWISKPTNQKHIPERFRQNLAAILVKIVGSSKEMKLSAADLTRFGSEYARLNPEYSGNDKGSIHLQDYDTEIELMISKLKKAAERSGGTLKLSDMNREQMEWLRKTIKGLRKALENANELVSAESNRKASEEAEAFIEMADTMRKAQRGKVLRSLLDMFSLSMLTPEMFMKGLGDRMYNILWKGYSKGHAKKATMTQQAMDFMNDLINPSEVSGWQKAALKEVTLTRTGENGETISHTLYMSIPQIMYLHCAVKRNQAKKHLFGDDKTAGSGMKIEPEEKIRLRGRKTAKKALEQTEVLKLTEDEVREVTALLTDRQKEVADKMQKFLTEVVSEWGNETSMLMYGYRKFTESNYVPIIVDSEYTNKMYGKENTDAKTLQNMGAAKEVSEWAGQPIVITDIFSLFNRHVDQMSSYNAFVPILSDTNKFMNYMKMPKNQNDLVTKEEADAIRATMTEEEIQAWEDIRKANEEDNEMPAVEEKEKAGPVAFVNKTELKSVKNAMSHILGPKAEAYMHKLMVDINGAAKKDDVGVVPQMALRNMKIASVGANLRVVVQQPMSMFRAMAEMNPVDVLFAPFALPKDWEKMRKYAPITLWKDWGGAEMDTGRTLEEMIAGQSLFNKITGLSMAPAGAFDKLTWGRLWKGCEMEVKRKHPDWVGERLDEAVGERFTQVIDRTQVVDSVLHRSENMRSKSFFVKMTTSFMSEPIKGYNLVYDAVRGVYRNPKDKETHKRLTRVLFTHFINAVMVSLAAGLVDAMRDSEDDDDEFWDTWLAASVGDYSKAVTLKDKAAAFWASNLNDNLNPMNMLPYVKDVYSVIQGYDVVRTDFSWATDIVRWVQKTKKMNEGGSEYSVKGYILYTAAQFSKVTGMPAKSLERDLYGLADTLIQHAFGDAEGRYNLRTFKYAPGKEDNASMYAEMIVMARFNGDTVLANRIKKDMLNGGLDEEKLDTKLENAYSNKVEIAYIEGDTAKLAEIRNQIQKDGYKEKVYNQGVRDGAKELFEAALAVKDEDEARRLMKVVEEHNGGTDSMMEDFNDTFNN